ncbi:hypothetical protein D3C85_1828360 [compost metagenome]
MKQKCENNRCWKRKYQIQEIQHECIPHNRIKLAHGEQLAEVIEPDPFASGYALKNTVILERYRRAIHGYIFENNEINNGKDK